MLSFHVVHTMLKTAWYANIYTIGYSISASFGIHSGYKKEMYLTFGKNTQEYTVIKDTRVQSIKAKKPLR